MDLKLAIILPTLNERDNIEPVIKRLRHTLDEPLGCDGWEAIFVDDNSKDGTADVLREISLKDSRIRVIERVGRSGLASAVIEGICATAAPYMAVMDADLQHDPSLLPAMLDVVVSKEYDIAVGSRFIEGASAEGLSSKRRNRASHFANRAARRLANVTLTDPMSGFFLMETQRARALVPKLSGIGFKILLDILMISPEPMKVREFPLQFSERSNGMSKLDRAVAFEFLIGLYERLFGKYVPTRFVLFGTVGALGVGVHLLVLTLLFTIIGMTFLVAQAAATFVAMTFNFWVNNGLTYRDRRLSGMREIAKGWAGFCATCSLGALANIAVAGFIKGNGGHWIIAALAGITVGAVWNYALSNRFVWKRY